MRPVVTVSSNTLDAKNLVDGKDDTVWLTTHDDDIPTLVFEFPRTLKARRLLLSQAFPRPGDLGRAAVIKEIEVAWNKRRKFIRIKLHDNPLAPTEYEFSKTLSLRRLTIRIIRRSGKAGLPVGFAEIVLKAKRK